MVNLLFAFFRLRLPASKIDDLDKFQEYHKYRVYKRLKILIKHIDIYNLTINLTYRQHRRAICKKFTKKSVFFVLFLSVSSKKNYTI